jgi:hypothetical protein
VAVQWRDGTTWHTVGHDLSDRFGRYRVTGLAPGTYRTLWHGDTGPLVTLRG